MVMWTVDGDIRDQLGDLAKSSQSVDDWYRRFDELLTRAQEMIYKEQNILFPNLCRKLQQRRLVIKFTKIQRSMKTFWCNTYCLARS